MHRLSHQKLEKLQNDVTVCFDRMVRNLTILCSGSFEILDQVCKLQNSTLAKIKYKVQTSLGVSEGTCCNTKEYAIYGQCQGSENSGTNWNLHSVPMMCVFGNEYEGFKMNSPNQKNKPTKNTTAFVDDSRQYANDWYWILCIH